MAIVGSFVRDLRRHLHVDLLDSVESGDRLDALLLEQVFDGASGCSKHDLERNTVLVDHHILNKSEAHDIFVQIGILNLFERFENSIFINHFNPFRLGAHDTKSRK